MQQTPIYSFAIGAICGALALSVTGVPQRAPSRPSAPAPSLGAGSASHSAPAASSSSSSSSSPSASSSSAASSSQPTTFSFQPIVVGEEPIEPLPSIEEFFEDYLEIDYSEAKVALGAQLFHDTRLSSDNTLSCASCHDLRYGGIDRAQTATGVEGHIGPINTPTVFNAALSFRQFWDGRAADLEAQADGPPNAAGEMASSWEEISGKLSKDQDIVDKLEAAYPGEDFSDGVDPRYWLEAIADFERTLITPGAPFDAYLQGDEQAVSQQVKEGYQIFKDVGCTECHRGIGVGGSSFQPLGRKRDYNWSHSSGADLGRYNVTGTEADRHTFKVPNLRNVALTGPYFHDGSHDSLEEAVRTMGEVQLDIDLNEAQIERIVAFLQSLTGTYDERFLHEIQNTSVVAGKH